MADAATPPTPAVTIPPELAEKFPELIGLILRSESMNDGERQYWVNILPVMTPEQVQSLRDILENERTQLAAIDEKYAKAMATVGETRRLEDIAEERTQKKQARTAQETQARASEEEHAASVLDAIDKQG